MLISLLLSCILCVTLSWSVITRELQDEEYCISEVFRPSCNDDEIIVILEAHFGRKQIGRCLQDDEGLTETNLKDERYIGCYNDVKANLAPKCSGKTSCEVRVAELSSPKSCYNYLKSYLGIAYRCIKMTQGDKNCVITLNGPHPQYLPLGMLASKTGCGSHFKPWIVETLKGQQISINLEDFSISETNKATTQKKIISPLYNCNDHLGYIGERTDNRNITICMNGENSNTKFTYFLSKSNLVEVVTARDVKERILALKLEVVGCSDLIPPADAWLKRTENEATIGCYSTRLRWQLKCVGQRWIGVIGNCSYAHPHQYEMQSNPAREIKDNNQGVIVLGIVMFGAVVCIFIACIGIVCLKRHYALSKTNAMKQFSLGPRGEGEVNTLKNGKFPQSPSQQPKDDLLNANGIMEARDLTQYYELDQCIIKSDQ